MMREDAVCGVTSNPTIFQKAMAEGTRYDEQLRGLARRGRDPTEAFFELAAQRRRQACDLMRACGTAAAACADTSRSRSTRRSPTTPTASCEQAQQLHEAIDRPNLYVKIPGTEAGLPAIEDMIAAGRSINVTLIFSLERHRQVMDAYIRGIERLVADGGDPSAVSSVASYFVSRVDTEADKRLERSAARRAQGQARRREREARLPRVAGRVRGRALGGARGGGSVEAVVSLGVDVDEEPGVSRRPLRRDADRAGDDQHDARGDDHRPSRTTATWR